MIDIFSDLQSEGLEILLRKVAVSLVQMHHGLGQSQLAEKLKQIDGLLLGHLLEGLFETEEGDGSEGSVEKENAQFVDKVTLQFFMVLGLEEAGEKQSLQTREGSASRWLGIILGRFGEDLVLDGKAKDLEAVEADDVLDHLALNESGQRLLAPLQSLAIERDGKEQCVEEFNRVETHGDGEGREVFRVRKSAISAKGQKQTGHDRPIDLLDGLAEQQTATLWGVDIDGFAADPVLSKAVEMLLVDGSPKRRTACSLGLYSCLFLQQVLEDASFLIV